MKLLNWMVISAQVICVCVIAFIPESLASRYRVFVYAMLAGAVIASAIRQKKARQYFFKAGHARFWIYACCVGITIFFSSSFHSSCMAYLDFLIPSALLYFLFANESSLRNGAIIMRVLACAAACVSVMGICEMALRHNFLYENILFNPYYQRFIGTRMMSTLMHPNITGALFVAALPAAYYVLKGARAGWRQRMYAVIVGCIAAGIILTFSRGSWLACAAGVTVWGIVQRKTRAALLLWLMIGLFMAIASTGGLGQQMRNRFGFSPLWSYVCHSHRVHQYAVALRMLKAHPCAGVGFHQYRDVFLQYSRHPLYDEVRIPDSVYLMHLAETGLVGFAGFVWLVLGVFSAAIKKIAGMQGRRRLYYEGIVFSGVFFLLNAGTYDAFLWTTPLYLFWILIGLLSGVCLERPAE